MVPRYMNFTVEGVKLADQKFDCDDTQCSVKLDQLRPQTSGVYKCEISSDAPHFNLISGTANMSVAGKFIWNVYVIQKLWLFYFIFFLPFFLSPIETHLTRPFIHCNSFLSNSSIYSLSRKRVEKIIPFAMLVNFFSQI